MDWTTNAVDLFESADNIPHAEKYQKEKPEPEYKHSYPTPTAEFTYENQKYLMTSSFSSRIGFSLLSYNEPDPQTIYLGVIEGIPSDQTYAEISSDDLQYIAYRGTNFFPVDSTSPDFGIFIKALESYVDAPLKASTNENWNVVMKNSRKNVANILQGLLIGA